VIFSFSRQVKCSEYEHGQFKEEENKSERGKKKRKDHANEAVDHIQIECEPEPAPGDFRKFFQVNILVRVGVVPNGILEDGESEYIQAVEKDDGSFGEMGAYQCGGEGQCNDQAQPADVGEHHAIVHFMDVDKYVVMGSPEGRDVGEGEDEGEVVSPGEEKVGEADVLIWGNVEFKVEGEESNGDGYDGIAEEYDPFEGYFFFCKVFHGGGFL
jgi:hypothetical protein